MIYQKPVGVSTKASQDDDQLEIPVPPLTRLNIGGFFWCSALAWICTRDPNCTRRFHAALIEEVPYFGRALEMLNAELSSMHRTIMSTDDALEEISGATIHAVNVNGIDPNTRKRVSIRCADWISAWERKDRHDSMASELDRPTVTFLDVRLDERQVLARWPQAREDLVSRCEGPDWSLGQTVYWVRHHNHLGFVRDRPYVFNREYQMLRSELIAGRLSCRVEYQTLANGSRPFKKPETIPAEHWVGHSLQEDTLAYQRRFLIFDSRQVQRIWPHIPTAQYESRSAHVKFLMGNGISKRKAAEIAKSTQPAKPGPKRSLPKDLPDQKK